MKIGAELKTDKRGELYLELFVHNPDWHGYRLLEAFAEEAKKKGIRLQNENDTITSNFHASIRLKTEGDK